MDNKNFDRNLFYSFINAWYFRITELIKCHHDTLVKVRETEGYSKVIQLSGRFAGRRPGWHIETSILERVNQKGFGAYVYQWAQIEPIEFEAQLTKAEKLMTADVKFVGNRRKLYQATFRVQQSCLFPKEKFLPLDLKEAAYTQINKQASSGFPYFRRKGDVLDKLIRQSQHILNGSLDSAWTWPLTRGFRLQIRESQGELSRKIRVMYPFPGAITLLESIFVVPFVSHFINTNTWYIIGKVGSEIGASIKTRFHRSGIKRISSTDISSFDQNMTNEVIICAFGILRQQLQLTPAQSRVFDMIVAYFCVSICVSKAFGKPVYSFIKTHGVPSGSGFTNMIDSIAHAICIEYIEPGLLSKCLLCGDDNIFDSTDVDFDSYCESFKTIFNLPISIEKTDHFNSWSNVYFLGFNWLNGIRYISPFLAINQVLWHTDFLTELTLFDREIARSASVLLNGINGRNIFCRLFPEIVELLNNGIDIRFKYLYGYQPPTTLRSLTGYAGVSGSHEPGLNASLRLHLDKGYLIR